jgi:hypothetical protein
MGDVLKMTASLRGVAVDFAVKKAVKLDAGQRGGGLVIPTTLI